MSTQQLQDIMGLFRSKIKGEITMINLYGSQVRGYGLPTSDVDAFIVYHNTSPSILRDKGVHHFVEGNIDVTAVEFSEYLRRMAACDPHIVLGSMGRPLLIEDSMVNLRKDVNKAVTSTGAVDLGNKLLSRIKAMYEFGNEKRPSLKDDIFCTYALGFVEKMIKAPEGLEDLPTITSGHPVVQSYVNELTWGNRLLMTEDQMDMLAGHSVNVKADLNKRSHPTVIQGKGHKQHEGDETDLTIEIGLAAERHWEEWV
ncbi:hypothetical protein [Delftia phage PhiW-14]|uniref:Polymerase nucleotidyl transferase domain-containing protein n=1 Tax=Delftia phage PhiW-14 TaxID=665032 RepID=C9DG83_BPW14|nr:hypothetical protein DP-phiW-14_gp113 [Delftia phage PhiW-14]ACV50134.1 hypothetical protein [Delftia phage PhiW-14]